MGLQNINRVDGVPSLTLLVCVFHCQCSIHHHVSKEITITERLLRLKLKKETSIMLKEKKKATNHEQK